MNRKTLAETIKSYRKTHDLGREEFAARFGISPSEVERLEEAREGIEEESWKSLEEADIFLAPTKGRR